MIPLLAVLLLVADAKPDLSYTPPPASELRAEALRRAVEDPEGEDPRKWSAADLALQGLFGAELLGDYLQTRRITKAGKEINPIMGRRGERVPPAVYFPAAFLLHTGAMHALPKPWRTLAQGLSVVGEGAVVGRNASLGVKF